MLFHNLCDASTQVLQQSHEVIDLACFHQSNALVLIEFTHVIHEDILQMLFTHPLVGIDSCDVYNPLLKQCLQCLHAMIAFKCDLQEERICHL